MPRHVYAVSDGTGATCELMVRAALSQFVAADILLEKIPGVRTAEQVRALIERAASGGGVIIFTMVSPELREVMEETARRANVPCVDVLGPILGRLADVLELSPLAHPGLLNHLDAGLAGRIEAIGFTIRHDDGLGLATLGEAEIVLVGISRTTKTPTSVYLSYHGWRAANVPLVLGIDPPSELLAVDPHKVVALTVSAAVLLEYRHHRQVSIGAPLGDYLELQRVREELAAAQRLCAARGWPSVDVTHRSIEETAAEVLRLIVRHTGATKDLPPP